MLTDLAKTHQTVCQNCYQLLEKFTEDEVTKDLLIGRLKEHEKVIWMLKAHQ